MKQLIFTFLFMSSSIAYADDWNTSTQALAEPIAIEVYRSPNCQCCHKWIEHLEQQQFSVIDNIVTSTQDVKNELGLPKQLASCHTAIVDGYIIEGHVPADDIKRLISEKPKNIKGLSVPQMPVGTPGMEMGARKDNFAVISFDENHKLDIYNRYSTDQDNKYFSHSD